MSGLIAAPAQIWLVLQPVDLRRGIDSLSALVQTALEQSPFDGAAFVFRNRAGNRLKVLLWDGNGVWLCQRRLHRGRFAWPAPGAAQFSLTQAEWRWLAAGVEWQRLSAAPAVDWRL